MKEKLLSLILGITMSGYAQLQTENFENNGEELPVGWQQLNVSGPAWQWKLSNPANTDQPPYQGTYAANMFRENVAEGTAEDWLITKQFLVPESAHLTFYSRLVYNGDQQTTYRVMLHTGNTPGDISSYIELQQWTELEINPEQLEYTQVTVPMPAASFGQMAYIAFVMNGDYGDGWLLDDVGVEGTMGSHELKTLSLSCYPNPVKDKVTITSTEELLSIKVFDSNGRECLVSCSKEAIDMTGLAAGLYMIKAVTPKGTETFKVFKN